ncbi:helix-turn-helix domain-containing protein [Streptomyces lunalinharesii]
MFSMVTKDILIARRHSVGLSQQQLAQQAGIAPERLEALEAGTGWPGAEAYTAVLDALGIEGPERERLEVQTGAPLSGDERAFFLASTSLWAIADHSWRITEGSPALTEQLPLATDRSSLLAWLLLDSDAERRLVNHRDLTVIARAVLQAGLRANPDDPALTELREQLDQDHSPAPGAPTSFDGTEWIWRTGAGLHTVWRCLNMRTGQRPDLTVIFFMPDDTPVAAPEPVDASEE